MELKEKLSRQTPRERAEICLTYVTRRGAWYGVSWKGQPEKSGGVAMNIGIHFFDLLLWLFGAAERQEVHLKTPQKMAGLVELERARVRWFLSTDADDLPPHVQSAGKPAFRSMTIDGQEIEFSEGFTDLHTRVYSEILAGRGSGVADARPGVELVHAINHSEATAARQGHPLLATTRIPVAFPNRRAA
jgi:UDP-N-acetyl-2-amino-2-deoxyglucuronate dehydrogenase